uniref:Uncharacterized protein n=1 Tax=Salix viminalis TaxID=40686 RepID=A0A6N2KFV0_SALVM
MVEESLFKAKFQSLSFTMEFYNSCFDFSSPLKNFPLDQASTTGHVLVQHHIKESRAILNLIVLHPAIVVQEFYNFLDL